MNIFYLDHSPIKAAKFSCDKHCVKMILESAQLLCTAHRHLDPHIDHSGYFFKSSHVNHPCSIWVRQSLPHYNWLLKHLNGLCKEYTRRYGKIHKVERENLLERLKIPPTNLKNLGFIAPPQAMKDECKDTTNTVQAYRNYYNMEKSKIAKWKLNNVPNWYQPVVE
jgi:hypothetical protein